MRRDLQKNTEIRYLHMLRCIAIFLVIALHCVAPYLTGKQIAFGSKTWLACDIINSAGRMGVPIFFMISGFLLLSDERTLDIKNFYKKRMKRIFIPFLCWDIIYFITNAIFHHQPLEIGKFFSELLVQGSKYHLWFLYQIMGIYLLLPFLKRLLDRCKPREQVLFFAIVLFQPTILLFINTIQPAVRIAPFGPLVEGYVGFFLFGYLLGTYQVTPRWRRVIYCAGIVGFLLNIVGNFCFSSPQQIKLVFNAGYSITHYLTAGALFLWFKEHFRTSPSTSFQNGIYRGARWISKLSFGIYLSHVLILEHFAVFLSNILSLSPASSIVFSFFATSVLSTLLIFLLSKCKPLRTIFL